MEKKTFTNIVITLLILALIPIGFGIWFYLQNQHVDWEEDYQTESKEPYNNYMVFNLLKNYKKDKEFIFIDDLLTKKLAEEEIINAKEPISYIFLGNYPYLLDDEVDSLMDFVAKGNIAFFASHDMPDTLFTLLNLEIDKTYSYSKSSSRNSNGIYDSLISTNFSTSTLQKDPNFEFNYRRKNKSVATSWYYFDKLKLDKAETQKEGKQFEQLGYLYKITDLTKEDYQNAEETQYLDETYTEENYTEETYTDENYTDETYTDENYTEDSLQTITPSELVIPQENNLAERGKYTNFIRVKYGKGYFYFHRNPVLFTNYYAIQKQGKQYIERTFSYLPEGKIMWDERSHYYKRSKTNQSYKKGKRDISPSPLSYILSQVSLAWAYYTLLIGAFLFIVFRGKRMQRIIPILRKEENTSLEFTKTVGQLYYLQKDHKRLTQLKIRLFLDFIRTKYHMNTQNIDDDFRKKLSERSGINREFIDLILIDIQKVNGEHEISEWLLRKIHSQIQEFYASCK